MTRTPRRSTSRQFRSGRVLVALEDVTSRESARRADYSALKALFADWKAAGITDLREFLREDPDRIKACSERFRVVKVNRRTLTLFEANDLTHLVENLGRVFRDDMFHAFVDELVQLWEGRGEFVSHSVNYTLSGRRLEIDLKGIVLPGHERDWSSLALSEQYARGLFEHSPVSLWVEDFSSIKRLMDEIRCRGITDLRVFTDVHPEFVSRCMSEIRVIDVNKHTLSLFCAPHKAALLGRLSDVFRDDMQEHFREQLIDHWQGKLFQQREVVNYALDGSVAFSSTVLRVAGARA
jgi:PAS domain-containing protein